MIEIIFGSFFIVLLASIVLIIGLGIYFIPSIIAYIRNHKYKLPIFILNLVTGVTCFGWIVAFIWAFVDSKTVQYFKNPTLAQEINELSELKERGILTQEEFENKKRELLDKKI